MYTSNGYNARTKVAKTVAGDAATKLNADSKRVGLDIANTDTTKSLWIEVVPRGATAPTMSATSWTHICPAEACISLDFGEAVDVYGQMDDGTSGTETINVVERY
jgi:hypothetical protein